MRIRVWNNKSYLHGEDEVFTSKADAEHYANWMEKDRNDVLSTKITKDDNGTYRVWHSVK